MNRERTFRPIEQDDLELLRGWRNHQQSVLRQQRPLSKEHQRRWYEEVVVPERRSDEPSSILVIVEQNGKPSSYGGLTNIDWFSRRAELSFLAATELAAQPEQYDYEFAHFLGWVANLSFNDLRFWRLFAETWAFRCEHIELLESFGFQKEGVLRQHVLKDGVFYDALLHGLLATDERSSCAAATVRKVRGRRSSVDVIARDQQ